MVHPSPRRHRTDAMSAPIILPLIVESSSPLRGPGPPAEDGLRSLLEAWKFGRLERMDASFFEARATIFLIGRQCEEHPLGLATWEHLPPGQSTDIATYSSMLLLRVPHRFQAGVVVNL